MVSENEAWLSPVCPGKPIGIYQVLDVVSQAKITKRKLGVSGDSFPKEKWDLHIIPTQFRSINYHFPTFEAHKSQASKTPLHTI